MPEIAIVSLDNAALNVVCGDAKVRVLFAAQAEPTSQGDPPNAAQTPPSSDDNRIATAPPAQRPPNTFRPPPFLALTSPKTFSAEFAGQLIPISFVPAAKPDDLHRIVSAFVEANQGRPTSPPQHLVIELVTSVIDLHAIAAHLQSLGDTVKVTLYITSPRD